MQPKTVMQMNETSRQSGRYDFSSLIKNALGVLGLAAILYLAFAPVEHPLSFSRAASGSALEQQSTGSEPATGAPDAHSMPGESQGSNAPADAHDWIAQPRECRLDAGIDTACTFN